MVFQMEGHVPGETLVKDIGGDGSRVVDNVHFPADIVGGALLGGSIALFCNPLW